MIYIQPINMKHFKFLVFSQKYFDYSIFGRIDLFIIRIMEELSL